MPEARSYDIKILATDINPHVLATGKAGRYPVDEMADVEPALRNKWTERVSVNGVPHLQLDEAALGLVTFRPLNLMGSWPMKGPFHAIFCRNVVILMNRPGPDLEPHHAASDPRNHHIRKGYGARCFRTKADGDNYRKTMRAVRRIAYWWLLMPRCCSIASVRYPAIEVVALADAATAAGNHDSVQGETLD
jgi:hypothetical protein